MMVDGRPLWSLNASELAVAYAGGLSPSEVTLATLARIGGVNPRLNAIITLDKAGALQTAENSARRWKDGRPLSALDGVPVTIKDNILAVGLRATWGSRLYSDYVPDQDELPVRRLRDAGAVILGKTNVPELTLHGFTDNALFGTTGNPWNPELTPGGSSGGAAASVASGMGALALGTDGGGSIRRPAGHTGLIGFKPSRDTVKRGNGFPAILYDFEVVGPIGRCVDDIIRTMEIIAGPVWPRLLREPASGYPRIAYAPNFNGAPVDPFIRNVVDRTVAAARSLGLDIELILAVRTGGAARKDMADHQPDRRRLAHGTSRGLEATGLTGDRRNGGDRCRLHGAGLPRCARCGRDYETIVRRLFRALRLPDNPNHGGDAVARRRVSPFDHRWRARWRPWPCSLYAVCERTRSAGHFNALPCRAK